MLQPHPAALRPPAASRRGPCLAGRAAVLLLGLVLAACGEQPFDLVVLHTNDVHARFLEMSAFGGACREDEAAAGECFGGAARRATAVDEQRALAAASDTPVLLVDAGDEFQGTLFYNRYRGEAAARVMNALGYDAMVVGNHEFDDGPEVLADFAASLDFPLLGTNVDASGVPALDERLLRSTVVERAGQRIGILGVVTEETPDLSSPGPDLRFRTIEDALREEIAALTDRGIDKIIVLSHSGWQRDRAVARTVEGIDLIVGGHTNTLLSNTDAGAAGPYPTVETGPTGDPSLVVTAFAWGKYLGRIRLTFDGGVVTAWDGEPILLDAGVTPDPAMEALLEPMVADVERFSGEIIGETAVDLVGREEVCRVGECNLGNLIADALLDHGRSQGVEIALQNGGGIRSSLSAGPITTGQLLEVLPFGNTASTFRLRGDDLLEMLEHAVSRADDLDNDGTGRFLQVAGLRYAWTPNQAPGERLEEVRLVLPDGNLEPIAPDREYKLIFNAFNRNGGDGFTILEERAIEPYDQGRVVSDIVADYIRRNSPVAPVVEGRIRMVP